MIENKEGEEKRELTQRCTPALPNPIPAKEAANITWALAVSFVGSSTAIGSLKMSITKQRKRRKEDSYNQSSNLIEYI